MSMAVEEMYEWMSPVKTTTYTVSFRDKKKQIVRITGHRNSILKSLISKGIRHLTVLTVITEISETNGVLSTKDYRLIYIEDANGDIDGMVIKEF